MRLEGWEQRLDEVVSAARRKPYALGEHDCFRFSCAVIEALTGVDRWPEFAGAYRTKREALRLMMSKGKTAADAAAWFFGAEPVSPNLARRGDIFLLEFDGEFHLGVCLGAKIAVLLEAGLGFLPRTEAKRAWRVG